MAFLDLIHRADFRISRSGPLLVVVFGASPSPGDVELVLEHAQTVASERGRISVLSLGPSVPFERGSAALRQQAAELKRCLAEVAIAWATVLPGRDLGTTFRRSALSALSLVGGQTSRRMAFGDVKEALFWVKSRPEQVPEVLRLTVDQLTQHLRNEGARAA